MFRPVLAAVALALSGCATAPTEPDIQGPELEQLYAFTSAEIARAGGLRTERDPPDAPVTLRALVRNFEQIAFFAEPIPGNRTTRLPLSRWESPIRIGVAFGDDVPEAQRRKDLSDVRDLISRFRRLTGLDIAYLPEGDINFLVLVISRADQLELADQIELYGGLPEDYADGLRRGGPSVLCSAAVYDRIDRPGSIGFAIALIKNEHRGVLRSSCFHEEMTQALGLSNDSPFARPSIFNDDEEFALLTRHDETLLAMLYDRRLTTGMSRAEALPLLPTIGRDAARKTGLRLVTPPSGS